MSKHTPGPWEFRKDDGWTLFADGESIMGSATYYPWVPSREADWRLIAAAPELLEALELVMKVCGFQRGDSPTFDRAFAAIAKAKGEQQ